MPAFTKPMLGRGEISRDAKVELGKWIRKLREAGNMTQADLAKAVGMTYYTSVSAIEVGRNVVPPERVLAFADALGVPYPEFGKELLRLTNPWVHAAIFAREPQAVIEGLPDGGRLGRPRMRQALEN